MKKLYRSNINKKIAGICGGLGEYLDIDPTIIRLGFVVLTLFGALGIVAYIAGLFIIPVNPDPYK